MVKYLLGTMLLALICVFPVPSTAGVNVSIGIGLPSLVFSAPPEVVVIPNTYVYAVPDVGVDIFFYNGYWWRPWEGRWYRSRNYNSGWSHYNRTPGFYSHVPSGWRNNYRDRRWNGQQWDHQRIPQRQLQRNWKNWEKNKHWERNNSWNVKGSKNQSNYQNDKYQHSKPQRSDSGHGKNDGRGGHKGDRR